MELKLTPQEALVLLNLLQAEEDYEGEVPKALQGLYQALKAWLREQGLKKSPAGNYYLAQG